MNNKQLPFRYPEELDEDIELLRDSISHWGTNSKNQALIDAVKISAQLIKKIKSKYKKELSKNDIAEKIIKMISVVPGESDITFRS